MRRVLLLRSQVKAGEVAEKTRQYQRFLERVLDETQDFGEINDILLRYATLEVIYSPGLLGYMR